MWGIPALAQTCQRVPAGSSCQSSQEAQYQLLHPCFFQATLGCVPARWAFLIGTTVH